MSNQYIIQKKISKNQNLHRFSILLHNVKSAKSNSDFAAWQTIATKCRGRCPRRPTPVCLRFLMIFAQRFAQHGTSTPNCNKMDIVASENGTSYFCFAEIAPLHYMVCETHKNVRITQGLTGERNGRTIFAPTDVCRVITSKNKKSRPSKERRDMGAMR